MRRRFVWSLRELSGAFGDLGTFLPHVVGAITLVGMAPAAVLAGFGAFYVASGLFYRLPMAVQPMKAVSAAVLIEGMTPGAVAASGAILGLLLLALALSGVLARLVRLIPGTVTAGLQLGLGVALAWLGIRLMAETWWLGLLTGAAILVLGRGRRLPVALIALAAGTGAGALAGLVPALPPLDLGLHLPAPVVPAWDEVLFGLEHAVLPQLPLTVTNAVIVAASLTRHFYPEHAARASERNLALSQGAANLLLAPFGAYPMCHGSGGIAAHHRFGARSGAAPVIIGVALLALGLVLGPGGYALLAAIPDAVLGALLAFSGLELAASAKLARWRGSRLGIVAGMGALCVAANPAVAFALGWPAAALVERLRPAQPIR